MSGISAFPAISSHSVLHEPLLLPLTIKSYKMGIAIPAKVSQFEHGLRRKFGCEAADLTKAKIE
jgi:hypothetical protein